MRLSQEGIAGGVYHRVRNNNITYEISIQSTWGYAMQHFTQEKLFELSSNAMAMCCLLLSVTVWLTIAQRKLLGINFGLCIVMGHIVNMYSN